MPAWSVPLPLSGRQLFCVATPLLEPLDTSSSAARDVEDAAPSKAPSSSSSSSSNRMSRVFSLVPKGMLTLWLDSCAAKTSSRIEFWHLTFIVICTYHFVLSLSIVWALAVSLASAHLPLLLAQRSTPDGCTVQQNTHSLLAAPTRVGQTAQKQKRLLASMCVMASIMSSLPPLRLHLSHLGPLAGMWPEGPPHPAFPRESGDEAKEDVAFAFSPTMEV
eukprot:6462263-Amphidinium_carterae.2